MARMLAGDPPALSCASLGEPLLPVDAHEAMVYGTAVEMFEAYQVPERAQILGFFDCCPREAGQKAGDFIKHMRVHDWHLFAKHYAESNRSPIDRERLSPRIQRQRDCSTNAAKRGPSLRNASGPQRA